MKNSDFIETTPIPKVLIAAPISGHKQYSINEWLSWIAHQEYENYDFALCVNGENQEQLVRMLKQIEIVDVHNQYKKPVILWNTPKKDVRTNRHHNIVHARESLRRYAIAHGYDYMLWLDTDTIPIHLDSIRMLMRSNVDVVSGVYFYKGSTVPVLVSKESGTNFTLKDLEEAAEKNALLPTEIFGLGCVLIDKCIFRKIAFSYSDFGKEIGDDYGYCYALMKAEISRWTNPHVLCKHLGEPMKNPSVELEDGRGNGS